MDEKNILLDDALLLVEQNFYFLHAGEFFSQISRAHDLSQRYNINIFKKFEDGTTYSYNPSILHEMLSDAPQVNNRDTTLFEYFVEFNAFRGICMAMVEALRLETGFRVFMQDRLGDRFENFFDLLSFIRNVLSHNIHAEIALSEKDFEGTYGRIIRMRREPNIHIKFDKHDIIELSVPSDGYSFSCHVDFASLENGMPFLDILSLRELFMLSEWCFNLTMAYRVSSLD